MISNLEIQNFRGIKQLKLSELSPINLIVGTNNAGKTSVLEAIYALLGSNQDFRKLQYENSVFRGGGQSILPLVLTGSIPTQATISALLETFAVTRTIDNTGGQSNLLASPAHTTDLTFVPAANNPDYASFRQEVDHSGLALPISTAIDSNQNLLTQYSVLVKQDLEEQLFSILKTFDKRVQRIDSVMENAGSLSLYVRMEGTGKIPIWLMGQGFIRLVSIYCRVIASKKKYILIDEIEQGMHYTNMKVLWKALAVLCKELDLQIFATTHSTDAIQAAANMEQEYQSLFKLIRLETGLDHEVGKAFDLAAVASALDSGFEVR
jgi:predicted ATP-dependent endonuclease of OLD family